MTCTECDKRRAIDMPNQVGQPCDICNGQGFDYLGRVCRHGCRQ